MFKNLFSNMEFTSGTGFFKVNKNELIEINQLNGNGHFGYILITERKIFRKRFRLNYSQMIIFRFRVFQVFL